MVTSVRADYGMGIGKVVIDENTKSPKISQKVAGLDIDEYISALKEARGVAGKPYQDSIDKNTKTLAALSTFETKLQAVKSIADTLSNPINKVQDGTVTNVFNAHTATATTSTGQDYTDIVGISAGENAISGSFSLKVNQLATSDMKKGTLQATATNTPLNITGSFSLGTAAGIQQTINITAGMSLWDIQFAVNSVSNSTKVMADISLTNIGNPCTYEFKLKAQQTGEAIILSNVSGTPLSNLGVTQTATNTLCGVITAADETTALNLSGNFTFQGPTGSATIALTPTMNLKDVVNAINAQNGATGITASYDMLYYSGANTKYQLKLEAPSGVINVSDVGVAALGLDKPITDFNSLCSKLTVDGTDYKKRSNSISDIMTGVNLTLKSSSNATVYGTITEDKNMFVQQFDAFITSYNDLVSFYNDQTKTKTSADGKSVQAADGADLYGNSYVRKVMTELKDDITGVTPGVTLTTVNAAGTTTLGLLGIKFQPDGSLVYGNNETFSNAVSNSYSDIKKLFTNTITNSNGSFSLAGLPINISPSIAGQNVTVTVFKDASGDPTKTTATFTLGGTAYPATVVDNGAGLITITGGNVSPNILFQGVSLRYTATLANGTSDATNLTITQGRMAVFDNELTQILDTTSDPETKEKIGSLPREMDILTQKNKEKQKRIDKITQDANKESSRIEKEFQNVYKITAELENIMSMIDSFNKVNG